MEAPEKIYFDESDVRGVLDTYQYKFPHDIFEYVRKDAFIEKVEDYLNSKLYDWVSITNPNQMSCANIIPKKDFIEDFRNHMKGE